MKRRTPARLENAIEIVWLCTIFAVPICFDPFALNAFYFIKSVVLVILVSALVGLVGADWVMRGFPRPRGLSYGAMLNRHPLQTAACVFALLWILSAVLSIMPYKSMWGNLGGSVGLPPNISLVLLFLIISWKMRTRAQVFRSVYVLLVSSAIVSLVGVLQYADPGILPWFRFQGRVFSTDGNPLFLSAFLAMCMPITLAMIALRWYGTESVARSKIIFCGLLVVFLLQFACLVLAQYSLTLLLFVLGIFSFFALVGLFLRKRSVAVSSVLFVLIIGIVAGVLVGPMVVGNRTVPGSANPSVAAPLAEQVGLPTLSIRVATWKSAVQIMAESPEIPYVQDSIHPARRLIGYGPETLIAVMQTRFPAELRSNYAFNGLVIAQPENHYLFLAVTLGLFGLAAFLAILVLFFIGGARLLLSVKDRETVFLTCALVAAAIQYCIYICLNASVVTAEVVFWLVLALTSVLARQHAGANIVPVRTLSPTPCDNDSTQAAWPRGQKAIAAALLAAFVAFGAYAAIPPLVANTMVQGGLREWGKNNDRALALCEQGANMDSRQAYYWNFAGSLAFMMAQRAAFPAERTRLLQASEDAYRRAIREEPELAAWRYRLGDVELFWSVNGQPDKLRTAMQLYGEADMLFPGNAVILNKMAFARMLDGQYDVSGDELGLAERNDPGWQQTQYYEGLLAGARGNPGEAGRLFLTHGSSSFNDLRYFLDFCGYIAPFDKAMQVAVPLETALAESQADWVGYAYLGIADVYAGRIPGAVEAFKRSASIVPDGERGLLSGVVQALTTRDDRFQPEGKELVDEIISGGSR